MIHSLSSNLLETGAVFTLGKSYLYDDTANEAQTSDSSPPKPSSPTEAERTIAEPERKKPTPKRQQSYFFVKNDPIVKIVCGNKQSGVVCESGRLFVWGYSQHGQLGLGNTEIVHKPSCVRTIKRLKEKVQSFCFGGNGFCVILSESGKVFFSGKNIFPFNAKVASLLESNSLHKNPTDNSEYTPLPVELREFRDCRKEQEECFTDIVAGFNHFVVLSSTGTCYGWGYNSHQQLGGIDSLKILSQPEPIAIDAPVQRLLCGRYCTLFVTSENELFLVGKFQKISIPFLKHLSNVSLPATVVTGDITSWDCVYLLLADHQVYRSNRVQKVEDLQFLPFEGLAGLLLEDERITKIASSNDCISFVTNHGRLLTTYDDACPFTSSEHFKELSKFRHFNVTDIACGTDHSLVLAFPGAAERLDVTRALELLRNGTPIPTELQNEMQQMQEFLRNERRRLRREHVEREISKDESITIETGDSSEVRFIDNGADMMNVSGRAPNELKPNLDVDEGDRYSAHKDLGPRKTHTPNISELIDYSDDDNDSISSQSTFHDEDEENEVKRQTYKQNKINDNNNNRNEDERKLSLGSKLNGSTGSTKSSDKMRKFFKELKSKSMDVSCKNPGSVLDDGKPVTGNVLERRLSSFPRIFSVTDVKYSKNDQLIQAEDRASKVCTIM
uniref:Uncharacterized protein n=1 Tax=Anopheles albimanus TaxID=7167 RepID=A0A182F9T0_ANOAL